MKDQTTTINRDELAAHRRVRRRKRGAASLAVVVLVVLSLVFSLWTLIMVFYQTSEKPRMAFFRQEVVEEKTSCSVAHIFEHDAVKAPVSGIFVPFVREGEHVAAGDLVGAVAPASMSEKISTYQEACRHVDAQRILSGKIGNPSFSVTPLSVGDSMIRNAFHALSGQYASGNLNAFRMAMTRLQRAQERAVLEAAATGISDAALKALEKKCADLKTALQNAVDPGALLFADQSGIVRFASSGSAYGRDRKQWFEEADPEGRIRSMEKQSVLSGDCRFTEVQPLDPLFTVDAAGGGQMLLVIPAPPKSLLKKKAGDLLDVCLPDRGDCLKNLTVLKIKKDASLARIIASYSAGSEALSVPAVADAMVVIQRTKGMRVPLRSLFEWADLSDHTGENERSATDSTGLPVGSFRNGTISVSPVASESSAVTGAASDGSSDIPSSAVRSEEMETVSRTAVNNAFRLVTPDRAREGAVFGLKIVTAGRVKTISVQVLATDGVYVVVAPSGRGESGASVLSEKTLYVVNPWSIDDGKLIG